MVLCVGCLGRDVRLVETTARNEAERNHFSESIPKASDKREALSKDLFRRPGPDGQQLLIERLGRAP